jgi:hypothetical protein
MVPCPSGPGLTKLIGDDPRLWYEKSDERLHVVVYWMFFSTDHPQLLRRTHDIEYLLGGHRSQEAGKEHQGVR